MPGLVPRSSSVRGVQRVTCRRASPHSPRSSASPTSTRLAEACSIVGAASAKAPRPVSESDSMRPFHAGSRAFGSRPPCKAAFNVASRVITASASRRCAARVPLRVAFAVSANGVGGFSSPSAIPLACSDASMGLSGSTPASARRRTSRTYTFEGSARFVPESATRPAGARKVPVSRPSPSTEPASATLKGFASTERLGAFRLTSSASPGRPKRPLASRRASPSAMFTSALAMRSRSPATRMRPEAGSPA